MRGCQPFFILWAVYQQYTELREKAVKYWEKRGKIQNFQPQQEIRKAVQDKELRSLEFTGNQNSIIPPGQISENAIESENPVNYHVFCWLVSCLVYQTVYQIVRWAK